MYLPCFFRYRLIISEAAIRFLQELHQRLCLVAAVELELAQGADEWLLAAEFGEANEGALLVVPLLPAERVLNPCDKPLD